MYKSGAIRGCKTQVWILAAQFEIRQLHLTSARKILGTGIGMCPKARLFKEYIALELQLGNIDRLASVQICYDMYATVKDSALPNLVTVNRLGCSAGVGSYTRSTWSAFHPAAAHGRGLQRWKARLAKRSV